MAGRGPVLDYGKPEPDSPLPFCAALLGVLLSIGIIWGVRRLAAYAEKKSLDWNPIERTTGR